MAAEQQQQPQQQETPSARLSEPGVGALLKASRLRVGQDLRDIADVLRIRYVYMEAIEDGRYDALPGPTYATGFIRAYAEHLGLDSEEVVRRLKAEGTAGRETANLAFPEPIPETGIPGGAIILVGIVIAVVAYGVWYVNTSNNGFLVELVSPIPERLATLIEGEGKTPGKTVAPSAAGKPEMKPEPKPETTAEAKPDTKPDATPEPSAVAPAPASAPATADTVATAPAAEPPAGEPRPAATTT
ncbi:MAG: helix-turn-helix domain-containing protein, partial [Rhodospirillales bacterium]